jgi:N6-adenosine-specific RNA methylase IME4
MAAAGAAAATTDDDAHSRLLAAVRRASTLVSAQRRCAAALTDQELAAEVEACRREIRALTAAALQVEAAAAGVSAAAAAVAAAAAADGGDGDEADDDDHGRRRPPPSVELQQPRRPVAAGSGLRADIDKEEEEQDEDDDNDDDSDDDEHYWRVPEHCVPIQADVLTLNWARLARASQFDVVLMDPPWQLATANPTRGVALGYAQLSDAEIARLPVPSLQQRGGFLFVWVVNSKYKFVLDLFDAWGYALVDEIVWVKQTVHRRLAKSHGYYLQHAKETCLVGLRVSEEVVEVEQEDRSIDRSIGSDGQVDRSIDRSIDNRSVIDGRSVDRRPPPPPPPPAPAAAAAPWQLAAARAFAGGGPGAPSSASASCLSSQASDVLLSSRRGQSQKPVEMHALIEALIPRGRYLEIFARKNNLRDGWVAIGNEVGVGGDRSTED